MEGHPGAWKYIEGFIQMGVNILAADLAFTLYNRTEDASEYAVNLIFGRDTECAPALSPHSRSDATAQLSHRPCVQ